MRLSQRLSTAASIQQGPSESSSAATYPEKSAKAQSRKSVSMRAWAFFSPSLTPILDRGTGDKHPVVSPQVPAGGTGGHAIFDHQSHRQIHHAVGGLTARWRQIRQGSIAVLTTFRTVMLRIRDHEITRTPHVEMPSVVQCPLGLRVPRGRVTTAWTRLPRGVATRGDDLWRWQVCHRRHPFGGIGSIGTRTTHGLAFLVRMLGPKLYDTCSSKAIIKPGKDAIVSLAVGFPRDIQPMRATLVGACASATSSASTAPRAIMRRTVTCRGFMVASPSVLIADAERCGSAAPGSRSGAEQLS